MNAPGTSGPPEHGAAFVRGIRSGSFFLLVAASVMLLLAASTAQTSLRLLILALGFAGAFFWALAMIFERRLALPWGWPAAGAAVAFVAGLVSAGFSDCPQAAVRTLLTWLCYGAGFVLALWVGSTRTLRHLAVRALCAAAVPIALYAVLQYAVLLDQLRAEIEADKAAALRKTGLTQRDYEGLLRRTSSKRVFSTFVLPNSLAGFLLIVIPPSVALAVAARRPATRWLLGAFAAAALLGLFLTFSKGGWLAAAVVLLLFLALQGRAWLRSRWRAAAWIAGCVVVSIAAGLLCSPALRGRIRAMSPELGKSARVRSQYWVAGVSMWRSSPWLGIGPGNFNNHYQSHKTVSAEETKTAHNDYVQILAECGPVALAGYVVFWAFLSVGALRRRRWLDDTGPPDGPLPAEPGDSSAKRRRLEPATVLAGAGGLLGIAAASFFARPLAVTGDPRLDLALVGAFLVLWLAAFAASGDIGGDAASARVIHTGLAFGVLGFVLHSFVDLDLYVDGVGHTAFVTAGLVAAAWLPRKTVRLKGWRQLAVLVVVTVAGLAVFFVVSRVSEAEVRRMRGGSLVSSARYEARQALRIARVKGRLGDLPYARLPRLYSAEQEHQLRRQTTMARAALEASVRINPLDHLTPPLLAECAELDLGLSRSSDDFRRAADAWRRAIRLNPSFADYHGRLAALFAGAARAFPRTVIRQYVPAYQAEADELSVPSPPRPEFLPALVEARRAKACAPKTPQCSVLYGEALELANLPAEAKQQFVEALDLHRRMVEGGAPKRQRLTAEEVEVLRNKPGLTGSGGGAIIPR